MIISYFLNIIWFKTCISYNNKHYQYYNNCDRAKTHFFTFTTHDRNNRYILSKAKSAYVEFKDVGAVNSNEINYYYTRTFSQYEVMTERVFTNDKGNYILSRTSMDKKAIDKKWYYYIYNKSDIKKLPSSPEEFRKQFKMDKKAEQERLAE